MIVHALSGEPNALTRFVITLVTSTNDVLRDGQPGQRVGSGANDGGMASAIELAREAFRRRAWREAFVQFSLPDVDAGLAIEDLECQATAAYLIGDEGVGLGLANDLGCAVRPTLAGIRMSHWTTRQRLRGLGPSSLPSGTTDGDDRVVGKSLLVAAATVVAAAVVLFGARLLGTTSAAFAFLVVWAPMTWLGTVSRIFQPRLPRRYHELRDFERDPRLYEVLGVRLVKQLLRRGPLAVFNPGLHLPAERSPERLAELEQKMKDAEASHFVLLVAMLGVVINAAARGWWVAAGLTLLFDVLMNGYPVMLQRYNRVLLYARFPAMLAASADVGTYSAETRPTSAVRRRAEAAGER